MPELPIIDPEYKALIPPHSDDELKQLEQNILSAGRCLDPLIVCDGILVDGYGRFEICERNHIMFEVAEVRFNSRDEIKIWIIDNQLGRRNLSKAIRIELAMRKVEFLRELAKKRQSQAGGDRKSKKSLSVISSKAVEDPIDVRKAVAGIAKVSEKTVSNYERVKENADPGLLEKVKKDEVKINTAYQLLQPEIKKRFKQADGWLRFIDISTPITDNAEANRDIRRRLAALAERLDAMMKMAEAAVVGDAVLNGPKKRKDEQHGK